MSTVPCLHTSVKRRQYEVIWIPNSFVTAILSLQLRSASCKRLFAGPFLLCVSEILPNVLKLKSLGRNVLWPLLSEWGVLSVKYFPAGHNSYYLTCRKSGAGYKSVWWLPSAIKSVMAHDNFEKTWQKILWSTVGLLIPRTLHCNSPTIPR